AQEIYTDNGPFDHPNKYFRQNFLGRAYLKGERWKWTLTTSSYAGFWNASNQIPASLVDSGTLSRFDAIDPSDGGQTQRHQLTSRFDYQLNGHSKFFIEAYGVQYDLKLYSNFTFFLDDPVNGDQIQQTDHRQVFGYNSAYTRHDHFGSQRFETVVGNGLRFDHIHNSLSHTKQRQYINSIAENSILQMNPYFYFQETWIPTHWFRAQIGSRFDLLNFQVQDELGGGNEGHKTNFIISPKANLTFIPFDFLEVFLNFGQGFHSNDARGVLNATSPANTYAKSTAAEFGVTGNWRDHLKLKTSFWWMDLNSELVFVGDDGTTSPKGKSRRFGVETELQAKLLSWLSLDADFTYSHARFVNEPSNLNAIPLAPTWTLSAGISADHPSGFYGSLRGRAISDRPANEDRSLTATGFHVWDLKLGYQMKNRHWFGSDHAGIAFELNALNLFNAQYRESQFDTTSKPSPTSTPLTDVHFTPGYPLTILGSTRLFF
ncbi:MAG: hypothetical protein JNK65_00265, partial [Deltaproteobacteria bacterium]|nr:hypothetical protein [Deltaproteobacteria bacterium]